MININIETLNKEIKFLEQREAAQRESDKRLIAAWKKDQKRIELAAAKVRPEKLLLLEEILGWRNDFVKTPTFKKAFEYGAITIFRYARSSYKKNGFATVSSSLVKLEQSGSLGYYEVSKHFGPSCEFNISDETIDDVDLKYLTALRDAIKSGSAYDSIAEAVSKF